MGGCLVLMAEQYLQRRKQRGSKQEQEFHSIRKANVVNDKDEFQIEKGDLVFQRSLNEFKDNYEVTNQVLGSGAFGTVQVCYYKKQQNQKRAVKMIKKDFLLFQDDVRLRYEIDILRYLDHPNILRLYEIYEDRHNIYLVTELCEGQDLWDDIAQREKLTENDAAEIMQQILSAVAYCHRKNVCHRDIKPENIIISHPTHSEKDCQNGNIEGLKNRIKLIDFGTSQVFSKVEKLQSLQGTSVYVAPEVIEGEYDQLCDVWSIGIILYIMMIGKSPYKSKIQSEILEEVKVTQIKIEGSEWENRSEEVKDLLRQMLNKDPELRITAKQALKHQWFQKQAITHRDYQSTVEAFINLRNFNAIYTFMVCQFSSQDEKDRLYNSFQTLDLNHDGKLTIDELVQGYKIVSPHLSDELIRQEAEHIMKIVDQDANGYISFSEWENASINKFDMLSHKKLRSAFELFDKDNSGKISVQEIQEILSQGSQVSNSNVWEEIIKEIDQDGDGQISFEEFYYMMQQILKDSHQNMNKNDSQQNIGRNSIKNRATDLPYFRKESDTLQLNTIKLDLVQKDLKASEKGPSNQNLDQNNSSSMYRLSEGVEDEPRINIQIKQSQQRERRI
eukprot:403369649